MNILYINHYAGSPYYGMEFRPYYLAREWVRAGHKVRILASSYSHLRAKQPQLIGVDQVDECIDGVEYTWFKGGAYTGNGVGRIRNILSFMRNLYSAGGDIAKQFNPDVVIASSTYPMDIWPARRIARLSSAKLVFEVHDLWPLSPIELGKMSRWHPFIMWVQAAENYAYRHADAVVSILPNVHEHMASHGLDLKKLILVPNGVAPSVNDEDVILPTHIVRKFEDIRASGKGIVGYVGGHGISNSLDEMVAIASSMQTDPVAFVLIGSGPEKDRLIEMVKDAKLANVHFLDPIPKNYIPHVLKLFDISYIAWQSSPLYRFGVSANKLFDYMNAGCVVVQSIDKVVNPIDQSGCGACVPVGDIEGAANAIRSFLSLPLNERKKIGERGRRFVMSNHYYPDLAARFLNEVTLQLFP